MTSTQGPRITLIGSGLAGALLATYLGRDGHEVDLYERRSDPHAGNQVGGRSINLALSTRGIHALELVGLADEVLRQAIPMRGRMIHTRDGDTHFQPYDKDPTKYINSIGRGALNTICVDAARKYSNVRIHFDHRCTDVDLDRPAAKIINTRTNESIETEGGIVIGVDGAFSAVRRAMQRLDRFDYSQTYLEHGYKELTVPPKADGGFAMEKNALHIWPRRSFMMIALPNPDGSFTCTLFWHFEGPSSFAAIKTDDDIRRFFNTEFPDAVPLMPTLLPDYHANPTGSMVTVCCHPWHHQGKVAILGDAAHAVVPFYGQGMNAAFEDVVELRSCMKLSSPDWEDAFRCYERVRKANTDALAELAVENFIEMRDKTGTRRFRARKKWERFLHKQFGKWYTPLYTMVSFTQIPYLQAVRRSRLQDRRVAAWAVLIVATTILVALSVITGKLLIAQIALIILASFGFLLTGRCA
jgi:kynurenine 3-monooxygenase